MSESAVLPSATRAPQATTPLQEPRKRRNWVPYALLLPGVLWLVVFFVLPMLTLGSQSLQEGNVDEGYVFTGNVGIYAEAFQEYWPQMLRSLLYAGSATVLALPVAALIGVIVRGLDVPLAPSRYWASDHAEHVSLGIREGLSVQGHLEPDQIPSLPAFAVAVHKAGVGVDCEVRPLPLVNGTRPPPFPRVRLPETRHARRVVGRDF